MKSKRILVVAPHPDDETLALGGTIAKYSEQGCEIHVLVVSGHLPPLYKREDFEKTVTEAKQAFDILGVQAHGIELLGILWPRALRKKNPHTIHTRAVFKSVQPL